jgi:hypothetical protein
MRELRNHRMLTHADNMYARINHTAACVSMAPRVGEIFVRNRI